MLLFLLDENDKKKMYSYNFKLFSDSVSASSVFKYTVPVVFSEKLKNDIKFQFSTKLIINMLLFQLVVFSDMFII